MGIRHEINPIGAALTETQMLCKVTEIQILARDIFLDVVQLEEVNFVLISLEVIKIPICENCNEKFPNWIEIDGVKHNVKSRKYCIKCSPFGTHNTKKIIPKGSVYRCNKCGDTNEENFYQGRYTICKKCKNKETYILSKNKRDFAINQLGGKCSYCGYDKHRCALDIHHKNPKIKDKNFSNMRHWSYERIGKEIKDCIILCKNCHSALHCGELE